jgi:hypothetical protein
VLIKEIYEQWQGREPEVDLSGTKSVSDGKSTQASSSGSIVTSNTAAAKQFYYGFLDEQEIFEFGESLWRIRTYDCIGESTFVQVLHNNASLYQVLENRHNSASTQERNTRKKLHNELFAYKDAQVHEPYKAIHFLDRLGESSKKRPEETAPWGWALIQAKARDATDQSNSVDEDALPHFLGQQIGDQCQLWAPLLTDAELSLVTAEILNKDWFTDTTVPFLEEIFSLHHIPDADIWGRDPTPLAPEPPPIILSNGFWLDDDVELWKAGEFTGKKLPLNLDNIRPLPPKSKPKAHIGRFGWFDIWLPTDDKQRKTQLYLLRKIEGIYVGFRLKIEENSVQISETYSGNSKVEGVFTGEGVTMGSAVIEGEATTLNSGSPSKAAHQPESSKPVTSSVPMQKITPKEPIANASSTSSKKPLQSSIGGDMEPKGVNVTIKKVQVRRPLGVHSENTNSSRTAALGNVTKGQPQTGGMKGQANKENVFNGVLNGPI